jgi:hypothetical protein
VYNSSARDNPNLILKRRVNMLKFKVLDAMTKKEFVNSLGKASEDIIQQVLDLLKETNVDYCSALRSSRLVEAYPNLKDLLPDSVEKKF